MPFDFSRREFLTGVGAAVATAGIGSFAMPAPKKLKMSFSTLGCPAWSWDKILDCARQYGFSAVELRGLLGNMDLPACPEFSPGRIEQIKKGYCRPRPAHRECGFLGVHARPEPR
jgi:hypothetical protein